MKKRFKIKNIILATILLLIIGAGIIVAVGISRYNKLIGPVSNTDEIVEIEVTKNHTFYNLSDDLYKYNLINSKLAYQIYVKFNSPKMLQAGTYKLSKNMDVKTIIQALEKGSSSGADVFRITFREGINMRDVAILIAENSNNTEEDVFDLLQNEEYINNLINDYWFITDEIKNTKLYYSLEGYLFPDTYEFLKEATVKDIFKVMLDKMNENLSSHSQAIEKNEYTVHELLTLASIIELEAGMSREFEEIAGVFYNRLKDRWTLGSDVTTYYAAKKSFKVDLTSAELNECNAYNTRGNCFTGLPVGPISIPGLDAIKGTLYPKNNNYYFFVADKNGKTYFNTTIAEHNRIIAELKAKDLWFTY